MKKILLLLYFSLSLCTFAQIPNVYLNYFKFKTFNNQPYLETLLSFNAKDLKFIPTGANNFQASISIKVNFYKDTTKYSENHYILNSPITHDTTNLNFNFFDVHRYSLNEGNYRMEISIEDTNNKTKKIQNNQLIDFQFNNNDLEFSDIQFLEKIEPTQTKNILSKNGLDLTPLLSDIFTYNINKLYFYTEIYQADVTLGINESYIIRSYINQTDNNTLDKYTQYQKQTSSNFNIYTSYFDITDLPSGNYQLCIEIRNKNNQLINRKTKNFLRYNTTNIQYNIDELTLSKKSTIFENIITDSIMLNRYIKSLTPIASLNEKIFISSDLTKIPFSKKMNFFSYFWEKRNQNPVNEWYNYLNALKYVDNSFKSLLHNGYETDRGRIYLLYGPPNSIEKFPGNTETLPYEIWHYHQIPHQSNVIFIFYNPNLIANDYILLHSNARGEISDNYWENKILNK